MADISVADGFVDSEWVDRIIVVHDWPFTPFGKHLVVGLLIHVWQRIGDMGFDQEDGFFVPGLGLRDIGDMVESVGFGFAMQDAGLVDVVENGLAFGGIGGLVVFDEAEGEGHGL